MNKKLLASTLAIFLTVSNNCYAQNYTNIDNYSYENEEVVQDINNKKNFNISFTF